MANRIAHEAFRSKLMTAADAAEFIQPGMNIGFAGFTGAGYPKEFPAALAERIKASHEAGKPFRIGCFTGASTAPELDGELAAADGVSFRTPYQSDPIMRKKINQGEINYVDLHLSHTGTYLTQGFLGNLDVAVVEVTAITADGELVPSSSVGASGSYMEMADKVILEVNSWQTEDLYGLHDIFYDHEVLPPNRKAIPILNPGDLIGSPTMRIDPEKVVAVIETNSPDRNSPFKPLDEDSKAIAGYLLDFLTHEVKAGRLPANLLPMQSGVGNVANAVLQGLLDSPFENLTSYTEVIQDGMVDLIDAGKVTVASATAFSLSPEMAERMNREARKYHGKIILRPQDVSNHPRQRELDSRHGNPHDERYRRLWRLHPKRLLVGVRVSVHRQGWCNLGDHTVREPRGSHRTRYGRDHHRTRTR